MERHSLVALACKPSSPPFQVALCEQNRNVIRGHYTKHALQLFTGGRIRSRRRGCNNDDPVSSSIVGSDFDRCFGSPEGYPNPGADSDVGRRRHNVHPQHGTTVAPSISMLDTNWAACHHPCSPGLTTVSGPLPNLTSSATGALVARS
jgi:hypothetical protein